MYFIHILKNQPSWFSICNADQFKTIFLNIWYQLMELCEPKHTTLCLAIK